MRSDTVTAEQVGRLDKIESASQHLLSIVNDILDRAVEEMAAIVAAERIRRDGDDAGNGADGLADRERVLRIADSCLQANSEDRVRPVLEAFGVPQLSPNR